MRRFLQVDIFSLRVSLTVVRDYTWDFSSKVRKFKNVVSVILNKSVRTAQRVTGTQLEIANW